MEPGDQYAPEPGLMERAGLRALRRYNPNRSTRIRPWTEHDRGQIRAAEKRAVRLAAITGAISGSLLAGAEIGLREWLDGEAEGNGDWQEQMPYWAAYFGVVGVVSGIEIAYLYWLVLRAVGQVGATAGLAFSRNDLDQVVQRGLSRAALDFPNPYAPIYDIDPYARVSRKRLLLHALAYRLKVGATSFLLRVIVRRFFARAAVRFIAPLLAVPVFAVWNALIVHWVMKAARIRAAGPIAAQQLQSLVESRADTLDGPCQDLILSAVEETIVRSRDAHPNFVLLLAGLFEALQCDPRWRRMDWAKTRQRLGELDREQQDVVLAVIATTAVIDGRVRRGESRLLAEAHEACGREFRNDALLPLQRTFLAGEGVSDRHLEALAGRRPEMEELVSPAAARSSRQQS